MCALSGKADLAWKNLPSKAGRESIYSGMHFIRRQDPNHHPSLSAMHTNQAAQQYQRQDVLSASPTQLVTKLYDLAILACNNDDRIKLRKVLIELISSLNFEEGGDVAIRLSQIYEFCMRESVSGDLLQISEMLSDLRDTWKESLQVS